MTQSNMTIRLAIFGALAVYVGLRLPGCYFVVLFATLVTLVANRRSLPGIVDQQLVWFSIYCFTLIVQVFLNLGDRGLVSLWDQRGELLLPVNILMLFACGRLLSLCNRYASVTFLAISLSSAYGSAVVALLGADSAASLLRPLENMYVIGSLSLALWLVKIKKESVWFIAIVALLSLPLALALPAFRGILSILAYSILLVAALGRCWMLYVNTNQDSWNLRLGLNRQKLTMLLVPAFVGLVILVGKGSIFRYTLYQIIGPNPLNGRVELLELFARDLSARPFVLLGSYTIAKTGVWSHNYIVDTIAYHGWIPAFFLVMFLTAFVADLREYSLFVKAVILVMSIGAFLQPIEFADGIAFQLSFLLLGFVASTSSTFME